MTDTISSFRGANGFLSNFFIREFEYKGKKYLTSEHLYQALKATNEEDHEYVRCQLTAGKAKVAGREIKIKEGWDHCKNGVMLEVLRTKFSDPDLKQRLIDTGDSILIEGNTWNDTYWGICRGVGKNILGNLLMLVRDEIRE